MQLGEYTQAVEAARKANNPKTWKEVNIACVKAQQFRCAETAGMCISEDSPEEASMRKPQGPPVVLAAGAS